MLLRRSYYLLKPFLPWSLRIRVRRFFAKRTRERWKDSWPINPLAGRAPEGWRGWPDGKKFAFVLTHDVEGRKGLDRCRELAELDMRLGFRAAFNFVPEGEYETPKSLRDFLTHHGFEVGVQDLKHDGKLYDSRRKFLARAKRINHYLTDWEATGFRSGSMLHNLDWIRDLNILYDSSTFDADPFEPQPDGANTIFPFWVPRTDGSGYVELPLTLPQDSTLFLLFQEPTIDIWIRKLDWIAAQGGLALLNVHPDYMCFDGAQDSTEYRSALYQNFLEYVANRFGREAWFALPREVAAHISRQLSESSGHQVRLPASADSEAKQKTSVHSAEPNMHAPLDQMAAFEVRSQLQGKRVAMVMFSYFPDDPRPRRAAEALASQGMQVEMICLRENSKGSRHKVFNGIDVLRLPISRRRGGVFEYLFQYAAFLLTASAILAARSLTRKYDLVYVHNMPDVLVFSGFIPKLFGARVILDLHDPMPELMMTIFGKEQDAASVRLLKRLEKWSLAFADAVITVNRTCAKIFGARSCPAEKVHVVMNSPDEEIFRARPAQVGADSWNGNKPFVIMYHGSLVERNGLDLAVEALARVRQSVTTAELKVFGSRNSYLERVMSSIREKGLEGAVHYLGPRSLEKIVEEIESCDVGVIPNQRNIFTELNTPTRIFEYLAIGKPVIAPRAPGICDYFDEKSLIFFELGNAEDLARKIEFVHRCPAEAAKIAARGQRVHQAHTWREERRRLTGLVANLVSREAVRATKGAGEPQPAPSRSFEEGA